MITLYTIVPLTKITLPPTQTAMITAGNPEAEMVPMAMVPTPNTTSLAAKEPGRVHVMYSKSLRTLAIVRIENLPELPITRAYVYFSVR